MSLSPCSVPGCNPTFSLKDDEMEIGLGRLCMDMLSLVFHNWFCTTNKVFMEKLELSEPR